MAAVVAGDLDPLRPAHERSYAYLLGLYLGDGWLSVGRRGGATLRIGLDARYPRIIDDCSAAMVLSMPQCRPVFARYAEAETVQVQAGNKLWLHAFPQHGAGRKHERKIALECWQQEIVERHPDEFVRGLDPTAAAPSTASRPSCRAAASPSTPTRATSSRTSQRTSRGLFCVACDALDVRWTLSNPRNVSVAHRKSVARLDALGCGKA